MEANDAAAPAVTDLVTNSRRSSPSEAMERLTPVDFLREAGAKAMVAEAESSKIAADWNTFMISIL